jgi:phosphonate transport system substrate-binding protein
MRAGYCPKLVGTQPKLLRFAVPPSLGARKATVASSALEIFLNQTLAPSFRVQVAVAESYPTLADDVLSGKADAGWAPPFVSARVERGGGRALVRLTRGGASTYRSALLCRKDKPVKLQSPQGLVAAWVDRDSTSGYLLALAWLKSQKIDVEKAFKEQRFTGSFHAAVNEVANGNADLTSTFASAPSSKRKYTGIDDLPKGTQERLSVVAYTSELPNDSVVVGPGVSASTAEYLTWRLLTAVREQTGKRMLTEVFNADGLEAAPTKGYAALYSLVGR